MQQYLRSKEEDANQGKVSGRRDRLARLWRRDSDIQANVEHGQALSDTSPQETAPASQGVGHEQQEADAAGDLDNAINTSTEERSGCASKSEILENCRSVGVDGIGASHLLANHEDNTDESALPVAWNGPHL